MPPASDAPENAASPTPSAAGAQHWRQSGMSLTRFQLQRPDRRRTDELSAADIQQLEAIAQAQTHRFRFPQPLENEFQQYTRLSARMARISVALLTCLVFATAPIWTPFAFMAPPETFQLITMIALGLMAPMFAGLTVAIARRPNAPFVEWLMILAFIVEIITIESIRYLSGRAGLEIEPSLAVAVPVSVLALARLPLSRCLILVGAYVACASAAAKLWPDSLAHRSPTAWLMEVILIGMVFLSVIWTRLSLRRQWAANVLLEILAYRDALTGLPNRRAFEEHYETLSLALEREPERTMLFALVDLDHFKALNDQYGHDYGDGALAESGLALSGLARRAFDMAARIGGEEFVLLLYDCAPDAAAPRAEAIVTAIGGLGIEHKASPLGTMSCSVGAVVVRSGEPLSDAYRRADECLYQAKRRGRNGFRVLT